MVHFLSTLASATLLTLAAATYYPPFLTPTAGDTWTAGNGHNYIVSWNQTLPANVSSADAATSATLRLGFLIDGIYPYLGETGGFYDATASCATEVNDISDLFTGPGFVNVTIATGTSGKRVIGWLPDTSVHTEEFTLIAGTTSVQLC